MGALLTRRARVAVKIEAVEGTAETLAGADANFVVQEADYNADISTFERKYLDGSFSPFSALKGTQMARMTFKVENKGSGTAGTAPALGKLLKLCGMTETLVAVTSATYTPLTVGLITGTLGLYRLTDSGSVVLMTMRGARGTWSYEAKVGEPGFFTFEFIGVHVSVTDVSDITPSGLETTLPPVLLSASLTSHAFATAKASMISFDFANELIMRPDMSKAEGFVTAMIVGRSPKGQFDPEMELVATHDWYGKYKSGAIAQISFVQGASAGNICTVTFPKTQYVGVAAKDREGIAALAIDFIASRNSANDEVSIAYT
jgi:hypothetical protein